MAGERNHNIKSSQGCTAPGELHKSSARRAAPPPPPPPPVTSHDCAASLLLLVALRPHPLWRAVGQLQGSAQGGFAISAGWMPQPTCIGQAASGRMPHHRDSHACAAGRRSPRWADQRNRGQPRMPGSACQRVCRGPACGGTHNTLRRHRLTRRGTCTGTRSGSYRNIAPAA